MDKTNDIFLPYDFTKHPAAKTKLAKSLIADCSTNPEKLLDTYSFAPDFQALVANNPRRHAALCAYSNSNPCSYSDILQRQARQDRQAEILWYDNHPEVPPSLSHCFLTIGESTLLHDKVLRKASCTKDIYTIRTEHAHAMRRSWLAQFHLDDSFHNSDTIIAPPTPSVYHSTSDNQSTVSTSSNFSSIDCEDNQGITEEQATFRRLLIRTQP